MNRFTLAFKAFFRVFDDPAFASGVERLLAADGETAAPARSDALTLLATLQREGRLVDFVMEPLDGYSDAQVGAAARDVHRDCGAVVRRLFGPEVVRAEAEGSAVEVPPGYDPAQLRLSGQVTGEPPFRGTLQHPGWRASRCEVPAWSGDEAASTVLAPAEIEVR